MKDQQQTNYDRTSEMSFKDSWMQNTIELAAIGGLVLGAGNLAMKGNLKDLPTYGRKALEQVGKATDRYINRRGGPLTRIVKNVTKGTYKNLSRMNTPAQGKNLDEITDTVRTTLQNLSDDDIDIEVARRIPLLRDTALAQKKIRRPEDFKVNVDKLREEVKADMVDKALSPDPNPKWKTKNNNGNNNNPNRKKEFVNSIVPGAGFGLGMTGMHALDRKMSDDKRKSDRRYDDMFNASGSFLPRKDDRKMNKLASARGRVLGKTRSERQKELKRERLRDGFTNIPQTYGRKIVEGLGTSTAFTAMSLGTANLLNKKKSEEEDKNRIIIEIGPEDPTSKRDAKGHAFTGPMGNMPRLASLSDVKGHIKLGGGN